MTLDFIRAQVKALKETNPNIHMDVYLQRPRLCLERAEATLTGAYPHIFTIEENSTGIKKCHSLQYTDILTGHIVIKELSGQDGE